MERLLSNLSVSIMGQVGSKEEKPLPPTASGVIGRSGVHLPKIEVRTFDGNLLNWWLFWEQFESTIHSTTQLTDSDKDGPASHVVAELTQTSESYMKP